MFEPLNDRVMVKPNEAPKVSDGGIALPERSAEAPCEGTVEAVGLGRIENGGPVPMQVEVGDVVVYPAYGGTSYSEGGVKYLIFNESDLIGEETMKYTLQVIGVIALLTGIGWFAQAEDLVSYGFFAPRYENVRRETFENTKSYNQGMAQEFRNEQREYIQAGADAKPQLRSIILHQAADYPDERMPDDVRAFIDGLRAQQ